MTQLTEIIEAFHMKANMHYNPSMDGTRDAYMEGRKEAYLDCANILEKWKNSIKEEELDELANEYEKNVKALCDFHKIEPSIKGAYKAGFKKAMEE